MRFRFRLRTLLVVTTLSALACAWLVLPTQVAKRFVRAVNSRDFATADRLLSDREIRMPFHRRSESPESEFVAVLLDWSLTQAIWGERKVSVMEKTRYQLGKISDDVITVSEAQVTFSPRDFFQ
jgi:hypothetical protein